MKVLILAGGYGTRLAEETELRPKPMVEIGQRPVLWHIMKIYSHYGFNDFVICLGYKGYLIKEYFANYFLHQNDVTIDIKNNRMEIHNNLSEPWKVTLIETGLNVMTGSRVKKAQKYIGDEAFMLTYGDGVADVDINNLLRFHKVHGKAVTVTAVQPEGRFGTLNIKGENIVSAFIEKPKGDNSWINAGYFVCEPKIFDYIEGGDNITLEDFPLRNLSKDGELFAYKHNGFWKPMDTLRDKMQLNKLWESGEAPWKLWNE
ncbi:MAG: glucose-1-phosphate cytidylyltransferase [bacterium]